MPLAVGTRLGSYEVSAKLGEGGMGEVYRARDTKLDRDVALKVLPPAVAGDPERLIRFEREAKSLATLNHPNIAQIYAVEQGAIVMELVPGETLHGPLPIDTALDYARQIASALEAAHDKGVIHRDLKPGNVMVTPDGVVKVLDFGLAGRTAAESSVSPDLSPTLTLRATQAGVILGTAAYMSPEQAAGKAVDKRADIWSFGVMLWELLTGVRLFDGETVSHTLADVLRAEIDFGRLPRETPAAIRQLLARCLDRDVKSRLRDIGEARVAIEKYVAGPTTAKRGDGLTRSEPQSANRRAALAWSVAALATVAAAALAFVHFGERPPVVETMRFQIQPPERAPFVNGIVLSPSGREFVFPARGPDGRLTLWVQSIGSLAARPIPGTEGISYTPFWSPDGRFVVFGENGFPGQLKKVDVGGGTVQTIAEYAGVYRGGDWSAGGDILFAAGGGVWHIAASGGTPGQVTKTDPSRTEGVHSSPVFLTGGRTFVYLKSSEIPEAQGLYTGSLESAPDSQSGTRLADADSGAVFVPPSSGSAGFLLFLRQGTLVAQALDERRQVSGEALTIAEDVGNTTGYGWFSASAAGALAYRTGRAGAGTVELVWFDRPGKRIGQLGPRMDVAASGVSLSPDGKRVAVTRLDSGRIGSSAGVGGVQARSRIWIADLARGIFSRMSQSDDVQSSPAMTPDGRVVFSTTLNAAIGDLYWMPADGTGVPVPLIAKSPTVKHPNDVSPDGRFLIYDDHTSQRQDLFVIPLESPPSGGERKPIPFLVTPADETFGQFSPDGKWIAYASNESGVPEVYVRGFAPDRVPAAAFGKWQVSTAGGDKPRWSHDGEELYYIALDRKLMAVPVKIGSRFEPGVAVPLFETNSVSFFPYDVGRDGRFLFVTPSEEPSAAQSPVTLVLNWQASIRK
jgi:Tol biopolymer transport system component